LHVFLFNSLWFWFSNCRVFKFSFVFSIFVLALVKVLVNCRFWSIGFSFGQVTLAQVLFFGCVRGWFCRLSKIGSVSVAKVQVWLSQVFKIGSVVEFIET